VATLPALRATLAHAAFAVAHCDAVLVTGDLVQDDAGGYANFRRQFGGLGKRILTIPGNHDDLPAMRRELQGAPFELGGHADFGDWRVVLLDSVKPMEASGRLCANELAALENALATAPEKHVLVCLHHHPVSMASRWLDTVGLENPDDFFGVLDRFSNVRAVLWGHVHQDYDNMRRGVRLLATPSTCAQFLPRSDDFAIDPRPPAYRILELCGNGSITTGVVWVDKFSAASLRSAFSAA
jgi:Icc protein